MKKLIFLVLIVLFAIPAVFSQEPGDDIDEEWIELGQMGIINDDGTISDNNHPWANGQLTIKDRERAETRPAGNQVYIEQQGSDNVAEWMQEGSNNSFSLKQYGNDNVHEGYLRGEDNLIKVLQQGNNLKLTQELEGTEIGLDVSQSGNEHELIHIEKSGSSPAYQIRQEGNHGMKVKIQHE